MKLYKNVEAELKNRHSYNKKKRVVVFNRWMLR